MISVKKDWWKNYFDDLYLVTDARSVCNPDLTRREVDFVEKFMKPAKNDGIVDLFGGQGRHSLELARRGYKNLTIVDYSPFLINLGKEQARKEKIKIKFYRRDARSTKLKSSSYEAVLVMANSFGYFEDEREDLAVLKEIKRILKKGGEVLLDLTDADYAKENLRSASEHQAGEGIFVYRSRDLNDEVVKAREVVISSKKGIIRDGTYCERLYSEKKIKGVLSGLGFGDIRIHKGVSLHDEKNDHGFLTSRMMVLATKR